MAPKNCSSYPELFGILEQKIQCPAHASAVPERRKLFIQSINQLINQPINQSIDQLTNLIINKYIIKGFHSKKAYIPFGPIFLFFAGST